MQHQTKRDLRQQRAREHLSGHCLANSTSKTQSRLSSRPTTPCIHQFRLACIRRPNAQSLGEPVMAVYCTITLEARPLGINGAITPIHSGRLNGQSLPSQENYPAVQPAPRDNRLLVVLGS